MNTIRRGLLAAVFAGIAAVSGYSQESPGYTQSVPFDNPGRPGILRVISGEGNVTITGYTGQEVRIKATGRKAKPAAPVDDPKAKGLKRVAGAGFSVTTLREENAVVVSRPMGDTMNLEIQVPVNTRLIIGGARTNIPVDGDDFVGTIVSTVGSAIAIPGGPFQGDVIVENINGEMEINTLDGDINLKNISGAVTASCVDGSITAVFRSTPGDRPLALSSIDGDIDVTFPSRAKAVLTASTIDGAIYTDFEMETVPGTVKKSTGTVTIGPAGGAVTGKINGGGIDIHLKTIDGSIYIRKGK